MMHIVKGVTKEREIMKINQEHAYTEEEERQRENTGTGQYPPPHSLVEIFETAISIYVCSPRVGLKWVEPLLAIFLVRPLAKSLSYVLLQTTYFVQSVWSEQPTHYFGVIETLFTIITYINLLIIRWAFSKSHFFLIPFSLF